MRRTIFFGLAAVSGALIALSAGCKREPERPAPPRVTSAPQFPRQHSTLIVPVEISLDEIQRGIERRTPRRLWSIDRHFDKCISGQRVKVFGRRLKVTPDIGCRIVGEVTRGAVKITGAGQRITITLPVQAVVAARKVGGVLKGETATASAIVRADVRLGVDRNWQPDAKVRISYDWIEPPGIDFLGQRIRFVQRADRELEDVIAGLERSLRAEVARVRIRPQVADAWKQGFAVIQLNRDKPPAWMRVTPGGIGLAGYSVAGRKVTLTVAAQALTETFIGSAPPKTPTPVALPPQIAPGGDRGLRFFIPVLADHAQLEPVVLRALRKLAARGISLKGVGHVDADFEKVTIYATSDNRLAVGVEARVEPVDAKIGVRWGKARGRVWLTGLPVNAADSQIVHIRDLDIYGRADLPVADLLIRLMASDDVRSQIATSLTQDFSRDYNKVITAARRAIASRQVGDFRLTATIDAVHHDGVQVTGAGLFLPVTGSGKVRIVRARR
ncbi:MAG: DUF4403 family protein [Novosphingobium sp.]|nr:DUF4403 family protein [Novosphingobium sp.]